MRTDNINGVLYFWVTKYFPVRFKVNQTFLKRRQYIYDFKDGRNRMGIIVAEILKTNVSLLDYMQNNGGIASWWLSIIPASTQEKTSIRFRAFCDEFCKDIELNNGYDLIRLSRDHPTIHNQGDRNAIDILDYIDFGDVEGKRIILFDDIITTGTSFLKLYRKLRELGAIEIVGCFLGKTHWLEE